MTTESSAPHSRKRVLLADASATDRERMKQALQSWGIEVDTASTGLEVLDLVRTHSYTLAYLDATLPVMNGCKTWEILRADTRFKKLPILMAVSSKEMRASLPAEDFIAILDRPVSPTVLLGEIGRHFDPESFDSFTSITPAPAALLATPRSVQQEHDAASSPRVEKETLPPKKNPKKTEPSSIQEKLPHLPGFDCPAGLNRVMGNLHLYTRLLLDFQNVLLEARSDIRTLREQNDIPGLEAAVHKIKGISGNLAADVLYKESVRLDDRLKEPDTTTVPDGQLDAFLLSIETTLNALSAINSGAAPEADKKKPASESGELSPPSPQASPQLIEALRETLFLLRQSNTAARESFERGVELFEGSHASELASISRLIDMFDFEGADRQLVTLANSLGIEIEVPDELQ